MEKRIAGDRAIQVVRRALVTKDLLGRRREKRVIVDQLSAEIVTLIEQFDAIAPGAGRRVHLPEEQQI